MTIDRRGNVTQRYFRYSDSFVVEITNTNQMRLAVIALIIGLAIIILWFETTWIGIGVSLGIIIIVLGFHGAIRKVELRAKALHNTYLEVDGSVVFQKDADGNVMGFIDTGHPYKCYRSFHVVGNAIYSVHQDSQTVTFTSHLCNCPQLLNSVLGVNEWPPGSHDVG